MSQGQIDTATHFFYHGRTYWPIGAEQYYSALRLLALAQPYTQEDS